MVLTPLFTRADDAGLSPCTNRGILDCLQTGLVRNVSVMVVGPAFEEAAELLRDREDIALGLHLTLNAEWPGLRWGPVSSPAEVSGLVDGDGCFLASPALLHERRAPLAEMVAEARAQLRRAAAHGLRINYLDTHMGVGWVLGETREGRWHGGLAACLEIVAREAGLVFADSRAPALDARPIGRGRDLAWDFPPAPAEGVPRSLVTHPARDGAALRRCHDASHPRGTLARKRDAERRAWLHPGLPERLRAAGWAPARYDSLSRPG